MRLEVRLEDETVWLNRQQLSVLFDRDIKTIGKHVNNALKEELAGISVVANFATTAADGKTYQVEYYNLDMILSIGYRVKSSRGVEFRRWANNVLKEYLLKGYSVNRRLTELEQRVSKTEEKIDFFVRTSLPPVEGVFYDGQIFDAYKFATDLIRSAKKSILIIDGAARRCSRSRNWAFRRRPLQACCRMLPAAAESACRQYRAARWFLLPEGELAEEAGSGQQIANMAWRSNGNIGRSIAFTEMFDYESLTKVQCPQVPAILPT